jgi:hypothetical protein
MPTKWADCRLSVGHAILLLTMHSTALPLAASQAAAHRLRRAASCAPWCRDACGPARSSPWTARATQTWLAPACRTVSTGQHALLPFGAHGCCRLVGPNPHIGPWMGNDAPNTGCPGALLTPPLSCAPRLQCAVVGGQAATEVACSDDAVYSGGVQVTPVVSGPTGCAYGDQWPFVVQGEPGPRWRSGCGRCSEGSGTSPCANRTPPQPTTLTFSPTTPPFSPRQPLPAPPRRKSSSRAIRCPRARARGTSCRWTARAPSTTGRTPAPGSTWWTRASSPSRPSREGLGASYQKGGSRPWANGERPQATAQGGSTRCQHKRVAICSAACGLTRGTRPAAPVPQMPRHR